MSFASSSDVEKALTHMAVLLDSAEAPPLCMLVCGGAALMVLGQVARTTHDIDLLACFEVCPTREAEIERQTELPDRVGDLARTVAADLQLSADWLNLGPSSLVALGLPTGLLKRARRKHYGGRLTALFVGRLDQIHLKLYAALGREERHIADLMALRPSTDELALAARWVMAVAGDMVLKDDLEKLLGDLGHEVKV